MKVGREDRKEHPAGLQDAKDLCQRLSWILDVLQHVIGQNGVKAVVDKRKGLSNTRGKRGAGRSSGGFHRPRKAQSGGSHSRVYFQPNQLPACDPLIRKGSSAKATPEIQNHFTGWLRPSVKVVQEAAARLDLIVVGCTRKPHCNIVSDLIDRLVVRFRVSRQQPQGELGNLDCKRSQHVRASVTTPFAGLLVAIN